MPLTLRQVPTRVTIIAPIHRIAADADPNWRRVEAVASRFKLPSHRRAVRVYLYAVLRDVDALRRFADDLLYPRKLRLAVRRGKRILDEARRLDPALMAAVMEDLGVLDADWSSS